MNVKETILADLITAMKAKDSKRLQVLRSLKAKLLEKEIEQRSGGKAELSNEDALAVLTKAAKQRKESIDQYTAGNRSDLVEAEKAELEIIESYLPAPMSEDEIIELIDNQINKVHNINDEIEKKRTQQTLSSANRKGLSLVWIAVAIAIAAFRYFSS